MPKAKAPKTKTGEKPKIGRPTDYNPVIAKRICDLIATHPMSVKRICAQYDDLPAALTIFMWMHRHSEFNSQYLDAKQSQALLIAEDVWDQVHNSDAEQGQIAKANLNWRFHQWHLSKLAPKRFSEKVINDAVDKATSELHSRIDDLKRQVDLFAQHEKEF